MCKQESYSKYQKGVIKFLTEYLGTGTPFTYERTQNNHLKVLIEGLEKPIFTSSTPSDSKSLKNFMADVKRELKANKAEHKPNNQNTPKAALAKAITPNHEKLTQNCIKSLRSRLDIMKPQEQEQVLTNQALDVVAGFRHDVIKRAISRALQERKQGAYIKPQEMKKIEKKLAQHLNFMMPTLADYSALLENKTRYQTTAHTLHELKASLNNIDTLQATAPKNKATNGSGRTGASAVVSKTNGTNKVNGGHRTDEGIQSAMAQVNDVEIEQAVDYCLSNSSSDDNSVVELMSMSANNRVSLLRDLSKAQALQLIDDINQAQALNLEQDIAAVVALIKEKNIPLEAIISRVEMA